MTVVNVSWDCKWVVSGYEDGSVVVWDALQGYKIRVIKEHENPLANILFLAEKECIVSADTGGFVIKTTLKSIFSIWRHESSVILNGSLGSIYDMKLLTPAVNQQLLDTYCLVAVSSETKIAVFSVRSSIKLVAQVKINPSEVPPLISWRPTITLKKINRISPPLLTIYDGSRIRLIQFTPLTNSISNIKKDIKISPLKDITSMYGIFILII